MDWLDISKIQDEESKVIEIYNKIDENIRLNQSKSSSIEFYTTTTYVEKFTKAGAKVLELGAGTGVYSEYLSLKGYDVTALELNDGYISILEKKAANNPNLNVIKGNALNLGKIENKLFDSILIFGPLYHLEKYEDRVSCIKESLKVLNNDGYLYISFINNDMVPLSEIRYNDNYFISNCYDHNNFKMANFPYVFHTLEDARTLLLESGLEIVKEIASDGLSRVLSDSIDKLDDANFEKYKNFHMYLCEKSSFIAASSHFLFICKEK